MMLQRRERETHWCGRNNWLSPKHTPAGDWAHTLGMCPDQEFQELNSQFGAQDDALTNWATGQGRIVLLFYYFSCIYNIFDMNLNYDIYKLQFYNIYGNTVKDSDIDTRKFKTWMSCGTFMLTRDCQNIHYRAWKWLKHNFINNNYCLWISKIIFKLSKCN